MILIIESDDRVWETLRDMFVRLKIPIENILHAETIEEIKDLLAKHGQNIQLVTTASRLKDRSIIGMRAIGSISLSAGFKIPIIGITGGDANALKNAGCELVFTKPISIETLKVILNGLLLLPPQPEPQPQ